MRIAKKIVKGYFVFTMLVAGMVVFGQTDIGKHYYVDVFRIMDINLETGLKPSMQMPMPGDFANGETADFVQGEDNFGILNVNLVSDPGKSFIFPGEIGKEIMQLQVKTDSQPAELSHLRLKMHGLNPKYVEAVSLVNRGDLVAEAKIDGRYVEFKDFRFKLGPYSESDLSIQVDLSRRAHSGQRLRLDLENYTDIELKVAGQDYVLRGFYPMEGKYLTVVKKGVQ